MGARYITTDLVLESDADLSELAAALERGGLFVLAAKNQRTTLEVGQESKNLEDTLDTILNAIEGLDPRQCQTWMDCSKRELDVGFDYDPAHFATETSIGQTLLQRMAESGVSLVITHYREQ